MSLLRFEKPKRLDHPDEVTAVKSLEVIQPPRFWRGAISLGNAVALYGSDGKRLVLNFGNIAPKTSDEAISRAFGLLRQPAETESRFVSIPEMYRLTAAGDYLPEEELLEVLENIEGLPSAEIGQPEFAPRKTVSAIRPTEQYDVFKQPALREHGWFEMDETYQVD
jgi:hypothetical protein